MAKHGSKNIDLELSDPEATPEERLLYAVFIRGLLDACSMTDATARGLHDNNADRVDRRKARMWFRDRGTELGGWYWLANLLGFSQEFVDGVQRRIDEDHVTVHPFVPKAQADARRAGVVRKASQSVKRATVAVRQITGQLGFEWWDNGTAAKTPVRKPPKRVRAASTLIQPALWAD